jgi:hypothetical protein
MEVEVKFTRCEVVRWKWVRTRRWMEARREDSPRSITLCIRFYIDRVLYYKTLIECITTQNNYTCRHILDDRS